MLSFKSIENYSFSFLNPKKNIKYFYYLVGESTKKLNYNEIGIKKRPQFEVLIFLNANLNGLQPYDSGCVQQFNNWISGVKLIPFDSKIWTIRKFVVIVLKKLT